MKKWFGLCFTLISLSVCLSSTALAEGSSLVCEARELVASGNGATGTIHIDMEALTIRWAESQESLLSEDGFCGVTLPESVRCHLSQYPVKYTPGFKLLCVDGSLNPAKSVVGKAFFVHSEITKNGRFHCQVENAEEKIRKTVEFSSCVTAE